MKNLVFPDEARAMARKDMADVYRRLRRLNPAYARLLYARERECLAELKRLIFGKEK